jgi:hypothetical protein
MYAAFLHEAVQLHGYPQFEGAARMMTDAGDMCRQFALACARAWKNKASDFNVGEIAFLVRTCADQEKRVFSLLKTSRLP